MPERRLSLELPFVKTVKQGGGVAPGEESFRLEIIRNGESVPAQYMKVSYKTLVTAFIISMLFIVSIMASRR